jgi:hypothetical protein
MTAKSMQILAEMIMPKREAFFLGILEIRISPQM